MELKLFVITSVLMCCVLNEPVVSAGQSPFQNLPQESLHPKNFYGGFKYDTQILNLKIQF